MKGTLIAMVGVGLALCGCAPLSKRLVSNEEHLRSGARYDLVGMVRSKDAEKTIPEIAREMRVYLADPSSYVREDAVVAIGLMSTLAVELVPDLKSFINQANSQRERYIAVRSLGQVSPQDEAYFIPLVVEGIVWSSNQIGNDSNLEKPLLEVLRGSQSPEAAMATVTFAAHEN